MSQALAKQAEAARVRALFEAAGATPVEADILQPAETLLDLYGEEIRGRAYVTSDALRGEQMLRPDFTVPVVQKHMESGAEPARYTYSGKVFRRQEDDPARSNEYLQVGYEIFEKAQPEAADAEVFALISSVLRGLPVRAATGDIGILTAAIAGLRTTERRKAALMRHIWRPRRFRALIERFSGRSEEPAERAALIAAKDPFAGAGPMVGKRTRGEIEARIEALRIDAETGPLAQGEIELMDAILAVQESLPNALEHLRDIAVDMPLIFEATERLARRTGALAARGVDVDNLAFEASYGRASMEYYDGFVFGFYAEARADLPPVASGGRYDALTRRLGQGGEIPAVGGVVRPGLMLQLKEAGL